MKKSTFFGRFTAITLALAVLLASIPSATIFATSSDTVITVDKVYASPDGTVDVNVTVKNNPGILGAVLNFSYDDDYLTIEKATAGDAFSSLVLSKPGKFVSPSKFAWDGESISEQDIKDGIILTLTFKISENAEPGSKLDIKASYQRGDIVDGSLSAVNPQISCGSIQIIDYTPGDVDGDKIINAKDLVLIRRYITGNYDVEINESAADVNDDGKINTTDIILIRRYIAGGYGVKLKPSHGLHEHNLTAFAEKEATCAAEGNSAYWYCDICEHYYSDEDASQEIALEDTVIEKSETHSNIIIDAAKAPTFTETGLTEGSHCSVCGETIVAQEIIDTLSGTEYAVTYNISHNDTYLAGLGLDEQIPEKSRAYISEIGLGELPTLEVDGYDFVGWFDGTSSQANRITEIPKGTTGNQKLYAKWELRNYTISFDSKYVTVDAIENHTVNKATALPGEDIMKLYGYRWLGWSDENGELYTSYPVGKAENVTLHANWQSDRNKAVPSKNADSFKVLEDEENGTYMFTFDLGTIENVPLQVINDFGKMIPGQPSTQEEVTTTVSLTNGKQTAIADTIAKATTKSSTWMLANQWNTISSVSKTHCEELGIDSETVNYDFTSGSTHIALSTDEGGSTNETVNYGVNAKIYGKNTTETGFSAKIPIEALNFGVSAKNTTEIGGEVSGYYDKTTVDSSYWNTKTSYDQSNSFASSTTSRNSLSQFVSDQYNYSTQQSEGGSQSNSEGYTSSVSESQQYSTTIAYTTEEIEEKTYTTTYTTELDGWWRQVIAGTIHVIGVVAYDIDSGTYSVFTYNVLDSKTTRYMDYSKVTGEYNDCENGVIPFEIPYSVNEYISYALGYSESIEIDAETGKLHSYKGDAEHVHIPDYFNIDNDDGTYTAVKVTGIEPGVFENNTSIKSVRLGKHITEIPENCFKGCTELKAIEYNTLTSIGANAFDGCVSLEKLVIPTSVTEIGEDAFKDVPEIEVNAASSAIVKSATVSGAKAITILLKYLSDELSDTILAVPSITENYVINGRDSDKNPRIYKNLRIDSNSAATEINGMIFADNTDVPLKLASEKVTLTNVTVTNSPGFAIMFTADKTDLYLTNKSSTLTEGSNAILAHGLTLNKKSGVTSLTANGKLLWCSEFTDNDGLYVGESEQISEESYTQLVSNSLRWVTEDMLPEGATVVNEKWTYDLTTNITSSNKSVTGYTLYDTTWEWGGYGAWSSWSTSSASSSDSRQVETKTVTDRAAYTNYRYWIYRTSDGYGFGTQNYNTSSHGYCTIYDEINISYPLSTYTINGATLYGKYDSSMFSHSYDCYWFFGGATDVAAITHTEYRYRDRAKVYTYYLTKTEAMESATEVTASDTVSNVQRWVQYVVK